MYYEKIGAETRCIQDEITFDTPDEWSWVRLRNIVYNRGQITPTERFSYIDIGSIDNVNQKLNDNENIIEACKAPSRARKIVSKGDILYSTVRPYLHNMCIIDKDFEYTPIASTGFASFVCHTGFYNKFLFYYLMSPTFDSYANAADNAKGVAYPAINDEKLYKALIPVPPVNEQHKIVNKIIDFLPYISEYEAKETELSRLNANFPELLKKSILQEAIQGKLVSQDPNDEPASVLLERIRKEKQQLIKEGKIKKDKNESIIYRRDNSHYEKQGSTEICIEEDLPFEIPDSWEWIKLGELFQHNTGKALNASKNEGIKRKYITTSNLYWDRFLLDNLKEMNFTESETEKCTAIKGDLLVCEGGDIGRAAIWNYDEPIFIQNHIHKLRAFYPLCTKFYHYVFYLYKHTGRIGGKGIGIQGLSANVLHNLLFPLPPLSEQWKIVDKIEQIFPVIADM